MNVNKRPAIPDPLKRLVRQRCVNGCVVCRNPIYEIHHIEEYAIVQKHEYENLVCLCANCHSDIPKGLLSKEKILNHLSVIEKARPPTSGKEIEPAPYALIVGDNLVLTLQGTVFDIPGLGYLRIRLADTPLIDARILNENGDVAFQVVDNIFTLGSTTWDIQYEGNTLTFRDAPGKIFAQITIDVEAKKIVFNGTLRTVYGPPLRLTDKGIFIGKTYIASKNLFEYCEVAISVCETKPSGVTSICIDDNGCGHSMSCQFAKYEIAILNSIATSNTFKGCSKAFVCTKEFLENIN